MSRDQLASATHASLPDCTIMPRISSATVTGPWRTRFYNMREPSAFQARCDTGTTCAGWIWFLPERREVR